MQEWLYRELNWGLFFNNICHTDCLKIPLYTNCIQHVQAEHISLTSNHASAEQQLEHVSFLLKADRVNSTQIFGRIIKIIVIYIIIII